MLLIHSHTAYQFTSGDIEKEKEGEGKVGESQLACLNYGQVQCDRLLMSVFCHQQC